MVLGRAEFDRLVAEAPDDGSTVEEHRAASKAFSDALDKADPRRIAERSVK